MCRKIPVPVVRAIQARHSVRTFMPRPLTPQDRDRLAACMEQLDNPFGVPVKVCMLDRQVAPGGEKLGTYGIIQGAGTFLGVSVSDTEMAPVAAGYAFENLILEATAMGLGTVWLAATFNRAGFASAMGVPTDALFPAISPVGYPAVRRRLTESLMRAAMRSSARKRWRELFYEHDFQTPLAELAAGAYAVPLESPVGQKYATLAGAEGRQSIPFLRDAQTRRGPGGAHHQAGGCGHCPLALSSDGVGTGAEGLV